MTFQDTELFGSTGEKLAHKYTRQMSNFRKKLASMCATKSHRAVLMTITPEMAQVMLERNRDNNRHVSDTTVQGYADDQISGAWSVTSQGIGFDAKGKLVDGQHRLRACVKSGTVFQTWVMFGLDDHAFERVDTGRKRTAGHIFHMKGEKNYNILAAASRLVDLYDNNLIGRGAGGIGNKQRLHRTGEHYHQVLEVNTHIRVLAENFKLYRECKLFSPSLLCGLHYLCWRSGKEKADEFFEQFCTGVGIGRKTDPVAKLRKRLIENQSRADKLPSATVCAYVIKAWNAWKAGKDVGQFSWRVDEDFPEVE